MKYFKDSNNEVFAYEDWETRIKDGLTAITEQQADEIRQPGSAELLAAYRQTARNALTATSVTMERIIEGVSLGNTSFVAADVVAWMDYRKALRVSISATVVGTLPTKPGYPAGT